MIGIRPFFRILDGPASVPVLVLPITLSAELVVVPVSVCVCVSAVVPLAVAVAVEFDIFLAMAYRCNGRCRVNDLTVRETETGGIDILKSSLCLGCK